jgi:hypothetical protein
MAIWYGMVGAAFGWLILNSAYVLICINIMHKRILIGEEWKWYFVDIGVPLIVSIFVVGVWRVYIPENSAMMQKSIFICGAFLSSAVLSALATPKTRNLIVRQLVIFNSREVHV